MDNLHPPSWIAVYTRPRSEKAVLGQYQRSGIEAYVPLVKTRRKWSDRYRWVELPLIPSYVFAHLASTQYHRIYEAFGVIRPVMFHGRVAQVQQSEIDLLQKGTEIPDTKVVSTDQFQPGELISINSGLFAGYRGRVLRVDGDCSVAVEIGELGYSVVLKTRPQEVVRILATD